MVLSEESASEIDQQLNNKKIKNKRLHSQWSFAAEDSVTSSEEGNQLILYFCIIDYLFDYFVGINIFSQKKINPKVIPENVETQLTQLNNYMPISPSINVHDVNIILCYLKNIGNICLKIGFKNKILT